MHAPIQELHVKFNLMSCSDMKENCRKFVMQRAKLTDTAPTHFFDSLDAQTANRVCLLHPTCSSGCQSAPVCPDLAVCGSPCHPFSCMRHKRFCAGSVREHPEHDTTFDSLLKWYERFEPKCIVFEQVKGFDSPEYTGDSSTPARRQTASQSCGV